MAQNNENFQNEVFRQLASFGDKIIENLAEGYAEGKFKKSQEYRKEVKLSDCISWVKEMTKKYSAAKFCLLRVEDAPKPETNEDGLKVTAVLLDGNEKPIAMNKEKAVSTIFYTETIDSRLINLLDGEKSVLLEI